MSGAGAARTAAWTGAAGLALLLIVPLERAWKLAPDLGHGWAAPLLIAYLWWERWNERPALAPRTPGTLAWAAAALAVALAVPLRLLLTPFPLWPTLVWCYTLLLLALAFGAAHLLAGRPALRWLGGPLLVLVAALPWGNQLQQHLIYPLREAMAALTAEVSNALGRPAIAAGTSVRLGHGWVGVDEACGGIRSLEASIMLALFFGEWLRLSWPRRAALVGAGIAAALLGNFLRILFLSLRAGAGTAAFLAAHDLAGWLALAFSLALTGIPAYRWARAGAGGKPLRHAAGPVPGPGSPAAAAAARWILVALGLLALSEAGTRAWYAHGARAQAAVPQWTVRLPLDAPRFQPAALGEEARELLVPDEFIAGTWELDTDSTAAAYYIQWRKGQAARFVPFLHNPTVCLPLAGCELERSLGEIVVRSSAGDIPFHAFMFRRGGEELAVAYAVWDTARARPLEKPSADSDVWYGWLRGRWADVREGRQDQPAQLLSLALSGPAAETRLATVLDQLVTSP